MPIKESDTDPSTPAARRPGVSTDPGVGPPLHTRGNDTDPDPRAASTDPGVAPPANPPRANDSIDALLDGISGEQPAKTKKQPQSRGEAAAAYQAEHKVLPGQPTPPPQPSVIVDRPLQPPTVRLDRAKIEAARAEEEARRRAAGEPVGVDRPPAPRPLDSTVLTPRTQGPRVVIALFAAILVVAAIFVAMRMWAVGVKRDAVAVDPTASQLVKSPPPPSAVAMPSAPATIAPPEAPTTSAAPSIAAPVATPIATAPPATTAAPPPRPPTVPDLKTDFKH